MRKRFISSIIVACALALPVMADDGVSGQPKGTGIGPNDGTGPSGVQDQGGMSSDPILGNRDDSQTRSMTVGDVDRKVDAILDQIKQSPDKASEKLFVLEAAMGNQWEIELSRLAQQKSQDPQVKELAQMVLNDHQQAQQKLMTIARQWNLDLPTSLPPGKQKKLDVLNSFPADKFETCYVLMLKADHAKDITSFADHQVALQDQAIKTYIGEVLPKLREHGQHVVQVAQAKNIGSGDLALGGSSSDSNMVGNQDQSQNRDLNRGSTDTNRKPTDTNPPR